MLNGVNSGPQQTDDLSWLFERQRFGVHPGLERVRALLRLAGEPQQHFQTVLVGGTNGKGSTAASLASMVQAGGRRVGLFTSPHLTRFSERFVVNGVELPEPVVLGALQELRPLAEQTGATFFEVVTVLGCLLFARAGVQVAVMEVGLGGRLDSTNALEPVLSLLTNVSLDHTAILGETPEQIATEKAGILRAGRPAVTGAASELWAILAAPGADLWASGRDFQIGVRSLGWDGSEVTVTLTAAAGARPSGPLVFRTPLLGRHGAENAALAAVAAARLGISPAHISAGAEATRWPGRLEVLSLGRGKIVLDGAHNPAGARALVAALRELETGSEQVGRFPVIFGAAADKDVAGVAHELAQVASRVVLTRAALSPRAADPAELVPLFAGLPCTLTDTPAQALQAVQGEPLSVACGSLYLIGELRPLLLGQQAEAWERWQ